MDNALEQIIPAIRMMLHPAGLAGLRLTGAEPPAEAEGVLRVDAADLAAVNEAIVWYRTHNGGTPRAICIKGLGTLTVTDAPAAGRMRGRVAVVTGAAQGFGEGIARGLVAEGANIVVADLNEEAGRAAAASLNAMIANAAVGTAAAGAECANGWTAGTNRAVFVRTDVADTASLDNLIIQTVSEFGGIDLFVSNAGVLRAGALDAMTPEAFDFVTRVNYNAYFYCVRAVAPVMKLQNDWSPENYGDVVQINSKSGLRGSKANFAYAGGKFGGVGLTQSFALELAPYRVKVNSVCPGNYYEGPLWSDPMNGLFVQYLAAGKVPGAKTVDDVRRHYMAQVPMGKGTGPEDVVRAILYLVEQTCETGQALPVTGGQVMLS